MIELHNHITITIITLQFCIMTTLTFDAVITLMSYWNYDCRTFTFDRVFLHCGFATFIYVKHLFHHWSTWVICLSVISVCDTKVHFYCVLGGDSGRPDGAKHSLHPGVYCEGSAHWRPGYSRKGMAVPEHQQRAHCHSLNVIMTCWLCLCPQLNIYTPLPQSAQAQFVPERPGVIQSGLTTARESILPFYLAVKVLRFWCVYLQWHIRID